MRLVGFVCVVALGAALLAVPTLARTPAKALRAPSRGPSPLPGGSPAPGAPPLPSAPLSPDRTPAGSAPAKLVDINTAVESELGTLPGIGRARAEAMIGGSPYRSKDELLRRKIIPANVYEAIKDRIVARQP